MTLAEYVRRRNGVPLGASGSLSNMLKRSLGAPSFAVFWRYWNPIWGYYLAKKIYSPLRNVLPPAIALVVTFIVSGALHDLAASLVAGTPIFVCTPWFLFLGIGVLLGEALSLDFSRYSWVTRATFNTLYIAACLGLTMGIKYLSEVSN